MKQLFKNILLIAGSGRNVGKTTLACQLIETGNEKDIYAVKITPHFHSTTPGLVEIAKDKNWAIFEETNANTSKDTARYLKSGAKKSYLIQVIDNELKTAFFRLLESLPITSPIIIESSALLGIIKPAMVLFVESTQNKNELKENKLYEDTDFIFAFDGKNFHPSTKKVSFNGEWVLV